MTLLYVLAGFWLLLELSCQLAHFGVMKVWRLRWDIPGRCGIALHPLLILTDGEHCVAHEKEHARQQARTTWLLWFVLYAISGRFRVKQEVLADVAALSREELARPWDLRHKWAHENAKAHIAEDSIYFPDWWPLGKRPPKAYLYQVQAEAIDRRREEAGVA